jgi:hypothetical protein
VHQMKCSAMRRQRLGAVRRFRATSFIAGLMSFSPWRVSPPPLYPKHGPPPTPQREQRSYVRFEHATEAVRGVV